MTRILELGDKLAHGIKQKRPKVIKRNVSDVTGKIAGIVAATYGSSSLVQQSHREQSSRIYESLHHLYKL